MVLINLVELFTEDVQEVELYDIQNDKVVYQGMVCDIPIEYDHCTVETIDTLHNATTTLTINISLD